MRNRANYRPSEIWEQIKALPVFNTDDLAVSGFKRAHLNVLLSRWSKSGKILRLKKGLYVPAEYLRQAETRGAAPDLCEYAANVIYPSSYLSLEYVLAGHNALTEMPRNYTSVSLNKTAEFSNFLGRFFYHKIKPGLFIGFKVDKKSGFPVLKASRAKALFDYLYFRKNILSDRRALKELRLNLSVFSHSDKKEVARYARLAADARLERIIADLWSL